MRTRATDLAWAAGIVDGEGTICMTRAIPGINRRTTLSFQVRMSVRMTYEETILRLQEILGGRIALTKPRDVNKHRPTYDWYVGDLKTVDVLRRIRRYMTTKRPQADLVLEFRKCCFRTRPSGRGATCSASIVALRLKYFERLKELNQKGPR